MNSFNAEYTRKSINEDGNVELVFTLNSFVDIEISKELEKGKLYRIKVSDVKSKRTLAQNRMMWRLLEEIAEADNGERYSSDNVMEAYIEALERANARFEYYQGTEKAIEMLKGSSEVRAIKEIQRFTNEKGNEIIAVKVFYGSSKMDIKEMTKLIEMVLDMATERGIPLKDFRYD